jgi:hypothetical protein
LNVVVPGLLYIPLNWTSLGDVSVRNRYKIVKTSTPPA